jgi:hypothetical protein
MKNATGSRFSVIPQGGLKEESWEWSDIEAMCRAGRLSPQSLIYIPEEEAWKKLSESKLATCFPKRDASDGEKDAASAQKTLRQEEYDRVLEQIRSNPGDIRLRLTAAELALAMGRTERARDHFQEALDIQPYYPRAAQEAKRNLPPSLWRTLKCLEKPPQVWEDPAAVFMFPYSRGPLYIFVAAAAVFGFFWTFWTAIPGFVALSLWAMETTRGVSKGENRAPLWDGFAGDPVGRIARPIGIAVLGGLELAGVFAAFAGLLLVTRMTSEPNVLLVIGKSALLTVLLATTSLLYLPAMAMLSITPAARWTQAINPKTAVRAVRVMEGEYLLSVLFVAALFSAAWGVDALLGGVPLVDRAFAAAATVYVLLAGSFVFGRLHARFRDDLESRVLGARSSSE